MKWIILLVVIAVPPYCCSLVEAVSLPAPPISLNGTPPAYQLTAMQEEPVAAQVDPVVSGGTEATHPDRILRPIPVGRAAFTDEATRLLPQNDALKPIFSLLKQIADPLVGIPAQTQTVSKPISSGVPRAVAVQPTQVINKCTQYSVTCTLEGIRKSPLKLLRIAAATTQSILSEDTSPGISSLTQSIGCWCQPGQDLANPTQQWLTCPGFINFPFLALYYLQDDFPVTGCQCIPHC